VFELSTTKNDLLGLETSRLSDDWALFMRDFSMIPSLKITQPLVSQICNSPSSKSYKRSRFNLNKRSRDSLFGNCILFFFHNKCHLEEDVAVTYVWKPLNKVLWSSRGSRIDIMVHRTVQWRNNNNIWCSEDLFILRIMWLVASRL
jgi:hypothetical protein